MPRYENTQIGYVTTLSLIAGAILVYFSFRAESAGGIGWAGYLLTGVLVIAAILFSSLTVEVDSEKIRFYFGPGFWKKQIPLQEIVRVESVQNPYLAGWGIRYTRYGWLYNVSGLDAVEIKKRDGTTLRIGTDEPEELEEAIRDRS